MEEKPLHVIVCPPETIKIHLYHLEKVEKIGDVQIIHLISAPMERQNPAAVLFLEKTADDFSSIGIQKAPSEILEDLIKLELINRPEPVITRRDIDRITELMKEFSMSVDKPVKQADRIPVPKFYKRNRFTR